LRFSLLWASSVRYRRGVWLYYAHTVTTMPRTRIKNVGVREFRDHASTYLSGGEPLAVSKHGQVIGFYVPVERDGDEVRRAVARLGEAVERVLKETGMNEDELDSLLDLRRPLAG